MRIKKFLLLFSIMCISLMIFSACQNNNETSNEKNATTSEVTQREIDAKELLKSNNARKALALSIDKEFIENKILANGSVAADYLVAKDFAYDLDGEDFRSTSPNGFLHYDLEKAREYWEAAKKELGFSSAKIEFLTADTDLNKRIAEHIQSQWQQLDGLSVSLNQQPFKNKLELSRKGNFDTVISGWGPDYADGMTFLDMWTNTSEYNEGKWNNDEYTKLVDDSKNGELANLDKTKERTEALRKAEEILINDDTVLIPVYQRGVSQLKRKGLEGIQRKKVSPIYLYKYVTTDFKNEEGKSVLRLAEGSDLQSTNLLQVTDAYSFILLAHTNEGLVNMLEGNKVDPAMAEDWDISADGKEYIFHLRKNAKWSNGDPVVAGDFVYSWQKLADPKTASQYSGMIVTAQIKNGSKIVSGELPPTELGVEAIDDYTLKVTLEKPVPYFMTLMARGNFYPLNKKFMEECGDKYGTTVEYSISNGPFKLTKWEIGYGYSVEKNENYYDKDKIKLDAISWRVIKDSATMLNMYENNEIDVCNLSGESVAKYEEHPEFVQFLDGAMFYIILNVGK